MTLKKLSLSALLALGTAGVGVLAARADCVLPREVWRLELVSVESVDGSFDTSQDRARLGETANLVGDTIDAKNPTERATVGLGGPGADASATGPAWSFTLTEANDD
jgi:hypothetical protein